MSRLDNSINGNRESDKKSLWRMQDVDPLSFPKFLALGEQEKLMYFATLRHGRENVERRDGCFSANRNNDQGISKQSSAAGFEALNKSEKLVFFATLKNASQKKSKNPAVTSSHERKNVLNVAVNVISKDVKKVKKTDKNGKRISRIRETEEEEENRFLLNILERREEGNASKKTVTNGVASTIKSEAQDCAGYVLSIILNRVVAKKDAPKDALRENKFQEGTDKVESSDFDLLVKGIGSSDDGQAEKTIRLFVKSDGRNNKDPPEEWLSEGGKKMLETKDDRNDPATLFSQTVTLKESEARDDDVLVIASGKGKTIDDEPASAFVESEDDRAEEADGTVAGSRSEMVETNMVPKVTSITSLDDIRIDVQETDGSFDEDEENASKGKPKGSTTTSWSGGSGGGLTEEFEEEECVAIWDKRPTAPKSRVRTLQDLLKDRAVLSVDSTDRFQVEWLPERHIIFDLEKDEAGAAAAANFHDRNLEQDELRKEKTKNKFFDFLQKCFICGRKETEKKDVVAEILKEESIAVETAAARTREAAF